MKHLKLFVFLISFFTILSCSNDDAFLVEDNSSSMDVESRFINPLLNTPRYSLSELIIQYNTSTTEPMKQLLREEFQVVKYEVCEHCDGTIELWDFGQGIDIEHKLGSIQSGGGEAEMIIAVDQEFKFGTDANTAIGFTGSNNDDYQNRVVRSNNGVTIAVLDSGIDPNYSIFSGPRGFLYNNGLHEARSGWDYVNDDHNAHDDNSYFHGTAVSYIISNTLNDLVIPHQILPIKVADAYGRASYFDMLCGISFASERAEIVQLSMGWYQEGAPEEFLNDIFTNLIDIYGNDVLYVTSAGNTGNNNDGIGMNNYFHYPSSYSSPNILAIAAANENLDDIAYFSNYGATSVDFFAPGENISFYNHSHAPGEEEEVLISGTSFSAPFVSAMAAKVLHNSGMALNPSQIINDLYNYGTSVSFSKPTKHNKLLDY